MAQPKVKRHFRRHIKLLCKFIVGKQRLISSESYYPEEPHKSKAQIFWEQCVHILRYGELNDFYYLYGLDVKGANFKQKGLIAYKEFRDWRNAHNRPNYPFNYICILRDKKLFSIVCEYFGIPCAKDLGFIDPGQLTVRLNDDVQEGLFHLLERENHIFCKALDAECGNGIFSLSRGEDGGYLLNDCPTSQKDVEAYVGGLTYQSLVQRRVRQHPEMSRLYPKSINTIRLVTIRNRHTGEIEHFHSLLRVGARGNVVDNWAQGGVCVAIDKEGILAAEAYFKPPYGLHTRLHPDTGVVFEGFKVPYYREAVELCRRFHKRIDFIPAIGWDVAITPEGPCIIEGNDNWEVSLHQIYGGLKARFDSLLR